MKNIYILTLILLFVSFGFTDRYHEWDDTDGEMKQGIKKMIITEIEIDNKGKQNILNVRENNYSKDGLNLEKEKELKMIKEIEPNYRYLDTTYTNEFHEIVRELHDDVFTDIIISDSTGRILREENYTGNYVKNIIYHYNEKLNLISKHSYDSRHRWGVEFDYMDVYKYDESDNLIEILIIDLEEYPNIDEIHGNVEGDYEDYMVNLNPDLFKVFSSTLIKSDSKGNIVEEIDGDYKTVFFYNKFNHMIERQYSYKESGEVFIIIKIEYEYY